MLLIAEAAMARATGCVTADEVENKPRADPDGLLHLSSCTVPRGGPGVGSLVAGQHELILGCTDGDDTGARHLLGELNRHVAEAAQAAQAAMNSVV